MRTNAWVIAACLSTLLPACRKAPPEELVFTGARSSGGSANNPTGGSNGGNGNAGSANGGSWSFGGSAAGGAGGASADAGADAESDAGAVILTCGLPESTGADFSKAKLLAAVAECSVIRYANFATLTRDLEQSSAALADDRQAPRWQSAQLDWQRAISAWQELELFGFGPAARSKQPGGKDLRDQLYGWPLTSRCKIEEQLVSEAYSKPDFGDSLISGRTLASLDYLLFYSAHDNACSSFSTINSSGSWSAITPSDLESRKAAYASSVARLVRSRSEDLLNAWLPASATRPAGLNFCSDLATAGTGSAVFDSDQHALNAVSDALFYIDKELKDWKLGRPVGYTDCFAASCPEAVELPFSRGSTLHIRNNLKGFRRLFQGCADDGSGLGFDDWLVAVGAGDLAARMLDALAGAESALAALPNALDSAVTGDLPSVQLAYARVKVLTDLLKTEFVTMLNLELPAAVEGDND